MSKQFPPADLTTEITAPNKLADALKQIGASKGGDLYMIDPTELEVMADFNVRVRNTDEWESQVKALMDSIRANGFQSDKPISVVADQGQDSKVTLWVVDGHTRLEAVNRLIVEGVEIETVPVVIRPKNTTFEDMLVALVTSNTGKPLTPYEMSTVVKRLQNHGWDDAKIAERLGITRVYVGNLTVLSGAPAKIRNQVVAGKLSSTEAVKLIRAHGAKASEVVEAAAEEAKKRGKAKITGKSVKAATGGAEKPPKSKPKKAEPAPEPAPVVVTDRDAINYALDVAADGLTWLRSWRAGEEDAVAELEAFVDPNGGL